MNTLCVNPNQPTVSSKVRPYYDFEPFVFKGLLVTPTNYPVVCGHIETHFHDFVPELADLLRGANVDIRVCSECGNFMVQGYCINDGEKYYCEDKDSACLYKNYTPEQWFEMYEDGAGDSYWTEWEGEAPEHDVIEFKIPPTTIGFTFCGHDVDVYTFREVRSIIANLFDSQLDDFDECLKTELGITWDE